MLLDWIYLYEARMEFIVKKEFHIDTDKHLILKKNVIVNIQCHIMMIKMILGRGSRKSLLSYVKKLIDDKGLGDDSPNSLLPFL